MPRKRKHYLCANCGNSAKPSSGYCLLHHAEYMREWRKSHPLEGEARLRMNARAYLHVYLKRGKVLRQPCEVCKSKAEAHHEDYSKPLDVRWLCRTHHLSEHLI